MSVIFDQLRISDDGKRMYINAHVNTADYFKDVYLDRLVIVTAGSVSETDPQAPSSDYIYNKVFEGEQKETALVLKSEDFNEHFSGASLSGSLFFVYIVTKGAPDACVPCRLDEQTTLGVTFDESLLYQMVMQHTKHLADTCDIDKGFIDLILLWNGFKAAVETEHYIPAIDFWNKMFNVRYKGNIRKSKPCGCHG